MAEKASKNRFRVKSLRAPEYAPETAGVFCGGVKLEYGQTYDVGDEVERTLDGEISKIARADAEDLAELGFGKFV